MELQILRSKTTRSGKAAIRFSKIGVISLSKTASDGIGIKGGESVSIAFDKQNDQDWYLIVHSGNNEGWIQIRNTKKPGETPSFAFNSSAFAGEFLARFGGGDTSVRVPLSTAGQTVLEGKATAYAIITKALQP